MTIDAPAIERWLPHRLPMRLVEELVHVDHEAVATAAVVRDTWPTAEAGCVRALVLIELVAQSAAVLQGWRERHERATASGGLLVGIPHATPKQATVPLGARLACAVRITHGASNYLAFAGEVRDAAGVVWLTATLQAFRPEPLPATGARP